MPFDPNVNESWTEELLAVCIPSNVKVSIRLSEDVMVRLAEDFGYGGYELERVMERLSPKLRIVEKIAAKIASAMLKGTLKYNTDGHSVNEWLEYLQDDSTDALNYAFLLEAAIRTHVPGSLLDLKGSEVIGDNHG